MHKYLWTDYRFLRKNNLHVLMPTRMMLRIFYTAKDHFAKMMKKSCVSCKKPLQLPSCVGERKYGLASLFYIKYCKCGDINCVASVKSQNDEKNGEGPFNVNVMLGVGVYKRFIYKLNCSTVY